MEARLSTRKHHQTGFLYTENVHDAPVLFYLSDDWDDDTRRDTWHVYKTTNLGDESQWWKPETPWEFVETKTLSRYANGGPRVRGQRPPS